MMGRVDIFLSSIDGSVRMLFKIARNISSGAT